eukprot:TRINITY_DN3894_c0_g2_i1.p2 TRINITY_DN3894_c0_g2~~TRINITY_DN3894_c0_g2_i1.p2  ORF type:complete len:203 (+),score=58.22 TRINITY_DN3894_c0_g2_i1:61-609(+)
MKAAIAACLLGLAAQVAGAVDCDTIVVTQGTKCASGNSLISEADATTCQATLCTLLSSQYTWAKMQIGSTDKQFVGPGYAAACGLESWDGADLGESLCAPGGGGGDDDGGLTGGAIFLIVFFVGGFVYFAGGFAYNYQAKQLRGSEAIPNAAFWKDLPALMKDGAGFLKSKVTGGGGNYTSV